MDWRLLLLLLVLTNFVIKPAVNKKIVDRPGRTRSLMLMFAGCVACATIAFAAFGAPMPRHLYWIPVVLGLGVFNSFACYCHWRALAISQSGTSVVAQADDLVAISLGYIVLGETRYLSWPLAIGIVLSLGSAGLLAAEKFNAGENRHGSFRDLVLWVLGFSVIWGTTIFSCRLIALQGVAMPTFILCWYVGSLLGSVAILRAMGKKEAGPPATWSQIQGTALLAFVSWLAMLILYLMSGRAPLTFTQPVLQASEVVFPTIIGLWVFKEKKEQFMNRKSRVLFGTAFIGGLLSALAYR